jgi:hypothetical protein
MSAKLTPFRVHFDPVAGAASSAPVVAASADDARAEALRRHPDRTIRKIKVDKSGGQP